MPPAQNACPGCGAAPSSARMGPVALQVCRACGAVGMDRDRLAKFVEAGSEVVWKLWWKLQEGLTCQGHHAAVGPCGCGRAFTLDHEQNCEILACGGCPTIWLTNEQLCALATTLSDAELDGWLEEKAPNHRARARETARALLPTAIACPECGQPNSKRDASCWACKRTLKDVCHDLKCPQCDGTLRRVEGGDVELRGCDFCGGIWSADQHLKGLLYLTPEKQERLLIAIRELVRHRTSSLRPGLPCPSCATETVPCPIGVLLRRPIPTCPDCCGRFLDLDHLEELVLGVRV